MSVHPVQLDNFLDRKEVRLACHAPLVALLLSLVQFSVKCARRDREVLLLVQPRRRLDVSSVMLGSSLTVLGLHRNVRHVHQEKFQKIMERRTAKSVPLVLTQKMRVARRVPSVQRELLALSSVPLTLSLVPNVLLVL